MIPEFMFATGIECSYPTVPKKGGGSRRVDELALIGHYDHWRKDFELTKALGIDYLRYGVPYFKVHLGPGQYDWEFVDKTFNAMRELGIVPIADLCHFGVPEWIGNFQNEQWPTMFAEYAKAFAARYPWVKFYTPVNEIYTTALFSGRRGMWNEALSTEQGFVRAIANLCTANLMAIGKILEIRSDAVFVQSEASQYFHPETPEAASEACFLNERRFLSLDLTYGYTVSSNMFRYLIENGLREKEFDWFGEQKIPATCVMGTDYYGKNEHVVDAHGERLFSGTLLGLSAIIRQYYERYRLPIMLTETNTYAAKADDWLVATWANICRLRNEGVPIVGYTWYSLTDQVEWDSSLTKNNRKVDSFGLCDLDRNLRDVGKSYRKLIEDWQVFVTRSADDRSRKSW
jgi:beta-glucosidase/6-phospho-beta-glucosidase/beta-galactosidase